MSEWNEWLHLANGSERMIRLIVQDGKEYNTQWMMELWEKINGIEGNREGPRRAGLAGEGGDTSPAPLQPGSGVAQTRTSARAGQSRNWSLNLHRNWVPDRTSF